jgi:two-component sensor histidine kinase
MFSPPKTDFTNFYDVARYNLTWKISLFLLLFMPILGTAMFLLGEISVIPTAIGSIIAFTLLVSLKIKKTFYFQGIFLSTAGTLLLQVTFIFYVESHHIVDTLYMIVIILFTFFTLGKKWGIFVLVLNLLGVIYFLFFVIVKNHIVVKPLIYNDIVVLSINFSIVFFLIAYLINQFIYTSGHAENKFRTINAELENNNHVKTILLKEIHHRVKNNLQVISSLLRIQSREIKDEDSKSLYEESINRVGAMALIHEKMYQTENLSKINLEEYVKTLANDLLRSYSFATPITVEVHSEIESLDPESLVPVALIFNELMSNSIKHGFKNLDEGKISISINKTTSDFVLIQFEDNGEWVEPSKNESFGLELIDSLTDQLNGTFKREISNGTKYSFRFP